MRDTGVELTDELLLGYLFGAFLTASDVAGFNHLMTGPDLLGLAQRALPMFQEIRDTLPARNQGQLC